MLDLKASSRPAAIAAADSLAEARKTIRSQFFSVWTSRVSWRYALPKGGGIGSTRPIPSEYKMASWLLAVEVLAMHDLELRPKNSLAKVRSIIDAATAMLNVSWLPS